MKQIEDPLLLNLHSSIRKLLYKNNIICAEDLFELKHEKLVKLSGIGPKRLNEIFEFLYSLPFDYQNPELPKNPQQNLLAGLSDFTISAYRAIHSIWDHAIFDRGLHYALNLRVSQIEHDTSIPGRLTASVSGTTRYSIEVKVNESNSVAVGCTCPYWGEYCKHNIAAIINAAINERIFRFQSGGDSSSSFRQELGILKLMSSKNQEAPAQIPRKMSFVLHEKHPEWELLPLPVYESMNENTVRLFHLHRYSHGPWQQLKNIHPEDQLLVKLLKKKYDTTSSMGYRNFDNELEDVALGSLLRLLRNRDVMLITEQEGSRKVKITEDQVEPYLEISHGNNGNGLRLQHKAIVKNGKQGNSSEQVLEDFRYICESPAFVLHGNQVSEVSCLEPAMQYFHQSSPEIHIEKDELESFLNDFYPELEKNGILVRHEGIKETEMSPEPEPRLYLSEYQKGLVVTYVPAYEGLEVSYSSESITLLVPVNQNSENLEIRQTTRNKEVEAHQYKTLIDSGLVADPNIPNRLYPEFNSLNWMHEHLDRLVSSGFAIYGEEKLKHNRVPRKMTSSSISVSSGENWFELQGEFQFGTETISLNEMWEVLGQSKKYVRLSNGGSGEIPDNWIRHFEKLLLLSRSQTDKDEKTRVPKISAPMLEDLEDDTDHWEADLDYTHYADMLRGFEKIEQQEPPQRFKGSLRSYQVGGLSWMMFLRSYKLGGVLADDMGLGKTVQVLALLQKLYEEEGRKPHVLIVAPRSVVQNWSNEAAAFIPEFSLLLHHGTGRTAETEQLGAFDLVITTYGTLMRDIELFSSVAFDYAILDESHAFRNPASKISRAVRKIDAQSRLCLSGTPVQNSAQDLWTQFQFLNPGMLGSLKEFKSRWVNKTGLSGSGIAFKQAGETLQRMLKPFVLRRTKQQVATDLPELTNMQVDCPMDSWQRTLYEKYRITYQKLVEDALEDEGIQKSRFRILEGLTRLRQLCCSPSLIKGLKPKMPVKKKPAKVERFLELAEELISEGHRALVFSQFVSFLKELEEAVSQKGWSYEYLDGKTRNRQQRVDAFEGDPDKQFFLISLKAGGEGLNLTSADYVFIMDPWWNPAAERQAMDRTHRIGQTRQVFVYRLVTPDSVEEKILKLQESKKDLSEKLITEDTGVFKELNAKDLKELFL